MAGIFGRSHATSVVAGGDLSNDIMVPSPPDDSISCLSWSPASNQLAVGSWDSKVRIYNVNAADLQSSPEALIEFEGPVLDCDWHKDGKMVVGCGADKTAKLLDLETKQSRQIAAHDEPIRSVKFVEIPGANPMIVTGSWDKTVKYWDLRSPTVAASIDCGERVYAMDTKDKLLVIALAGDNRDIKVVNLGNPGAVYKTIQSPLKYQTRAVSCFKEADGFMIGSTEGRCAFTYVDEKNQSKNMSFKCHRDPIKDNNVNIWTVNAISTHPKWGTFSSAGSDGTFHFWDKEAKSRLKGYPNVGGAISATAFSGQGDIFAYAMSYDWHKGFTGNTPNYPNKVMLHRLIEDEVRPKKFKR